MPLVRPGGTVLALKGQRAAAEADAARPGTAPAGGPDVAVLRAGDGKIAPPATVVRLIAGTGRAAPAGHGQAGARPGACAGKQPGRPVAGAPGKQGGHVGSVPR